MGNPGLRWFITLMAATTLAALTGCAPDAAQPVAASRSPAISQRLSSIPPDSRPAERVVLDANGAPVQAAQAGAPPNAIVPAGAAVAAATYSAPTSVRRVHSYASNDSAPTELVLGSHADTNRSAAELIHGSRSEQTATTRVIAGNRIASDPQSADLVVGRKPATTPRLIAGKGSAVHPPE